MRTATQLTKLFRAILSGAAFVSACGGIVDPDSIDSSAPCASVPLWGSRTSCSKYALTLADPATCLDCTRACGRPVACEVKDDGRVVVCDPGGCPSNTHDTGVVDGRRPASLRNAPAPVADVATYLARMAFYEAASVDAFEILHAELAAHGAPRALLRAIRRARADEVKHATLATELARRHGAKWVTPRVRRRRPRTLLAIALENAREGCARELLGALIGHHQATHASDPEVRAFYATIAMDETRHAALSLRLDDWLLTRLEPSARPAVHRAWRQSLAGARAVRADPSLGLPDPAIVRDYVASLSAALAA